MSYLSAYRVNRLCNKLSFLTLEAIGSTPAIKLPPVETVTNGETIVFAGNIARTSVSPQLFYDIWCNVSGTGGDGTLRFDYEGYGSVSVTVPLGTNGRVRGIVSAPAGPAGIPAAVGLNVVAIAPADTTFEAQVYWIDEIPSLAGYTPLSDVNALATGASSTVGTALQALEGNAVYLEQLLGLRAVPGFRPEELDFSAIDGNDNKSLTYRVKAGAANGYLYILWGLYSLKYAPGAKIDVTISANSRQVGTLTVDQNYGFSESGFVDKLQIVDALYPLSSISPPPLPQRVVRVDLSAVRTGDIAARITPLYVGWVTDEDVGNLPRVAPGDTVQDLTDVYTYARAVAGDNGTGYGTDGYDVAGGYPVGYAIVDGRAQALEGHLTHSGFYNSVINMEGSQYQVLSFRRGRAPHLLVKGKAVDVYYVLEDTENSTIELKHVDSVEDAENGELLTIDEIPYGVVYFVMADLGKNTFETEVYLAGAWEVYANV